MASGQPSHIRSRLEEALRAVGWATTDVDERAGAPSAGAAAGIGQGRPAAAGGGGAGGSSGSEPVRSGFYVTIPPRNVLRFGLPLAAILTVASVFGSVLQHPVGWTGKTIDNYLAVTGLDREGSLPTWFQVMLLMACGALLWVVSERARQGGSRPYRQWRLLSVAFVYLSVDEFVYLHERTVAPLRNALDLGGLLHFSWVLLAVPLLVALVAYLRPLLAALPRRTLVGFVLAGALYVGGAIGMEMISGTVADGRGPNTFAYAMMTTVEETFEMLGLLLFLAVLATYQREELTPATVDARR